MTSPSTSNVAASPSRVALCLCGGGATGAAWELGALAALERGLPGFRAHTLPIYVGTSAGSLVATLLAAGVPVSRLYQSVITGDGWLHIRRADVFQFDGKETAWKLSRVAQAGLRLMAQLVREPLATLHQAALNDFAAALPDGIFSLHGYQQWVEGFLARAGLARRFGEVGPTLLIPANNLDTGHRHVFGRGYDDRVRLSEAIAASSAIPLFFSPVRLYGSDFIDGGTGRVAHVDLAAAAGASHLLVINPVVSWNLERRLLDGRPDDADIVSATLNRIRSRGMVDIWNQSFRMSNNVKLHMGLRRIRADRPDLGLALIEPDERDETLFVTNAMNTEARSRIARHAFETVLRRLERGDPAVAAVCRGAADARQLDGLRRVRDDGDVQGDKSRGTL